MPKGFKCNLNIGRQVRRVGIMDCIEILSYPGEFAVWRDVEPVRMAFNALLGRSRYCGRSLRAPSW